MAAGLGFKTFTTGEVLTAADTNGYLMQGVLVFASAAARDAAITSPQEGQFAYLKDTNVTTYYTGSAWANLDTTGMTNPMTTTGDMVYSSSGSTPARLGIGSTGQVLTVAGGIPSWATAAGGGSLTLLSTTTLTGSSVSVTGISGSYTNLQIRIDDLGTGTAAGIMKMGLNSNTTTYASCGIDGNTGAVFTAGGAGCIPLTANRNMKDTGGDNTAALVNIYNYAGTNAYKAFDMRGGCSGPTGGDSVTNASGIFQSTTAVTSVQVFLTGTATFDGGPSMKIYGVN